MRCTFHKKFSQVLTALLPNLDNLISIKSTLISVKKSRKMKKKIYFIKKILSRLKSILSRLKSILSRKKSENDFFFKHGPITLPYYGVISLDKLSH